MQTKQIALKDPAAQYKQIENMSLASSLKHIAASQFAEKVISKVNFTHLPKAVIRLFKKILMYAISQDGGCLRFANILDEDPDLILEAVRHLCHDGCSSSPILCQAPVPTDSYFKYAGPQARRDIELIKKVIKIDQLALRYLFLEGQEFNEILDSIHQQRRGRP
ncbi:hypothetical protein NO1_0159 [Candidatus Termititenax aidoneus]|uniref:Uncharacterized protein n=1 Tax=Termititenax aidoneus TaxID=2218524 RepID=A0A388T800_TERA1|nr:hypothetical protein NO1_0159 [Candidatus Termititenax aidoneus]